MSEKNILDKLFIHKGTFKVNLIDYSLLCTIHHFNEEENAAEVNAFMQKYVFKPYTLGDNVVGVELNFNKEFYVPEKLEDAADILKEINELNLQINELKL